MKSKSCKSIRQKGIIVSFFLLSFFLVTLNVSYAIEQAPTNHLDRILSRGHIIVGSCGDYKPFTYYDSEKDTFEGIDIDMAKKLGEALGVEVKFYKTSWPNLMKDFHAGKYDIGMGGISVNLGRQKTALFSIPYLVDGKTPITLDENVEKFQTLKQIDQPSVTVIVNPGGTNEKFARKHLQQAEIMVYDDNVTIFDQIIKGKADLMITDAIETVLQENLNPELEAVHPDDPFTYSEKGYVMPRDLIFKEFVDQWLHLSLQDGTFDEIYNKWVK